MSISRREKRVLQSINRISHNDFSNVNVEPAESSASEADTVHTAKSSGKTKRKQGSGKSSVHSKRDRVITKRPSKQQRINRDAVEQGTIDSCLISARKLIEADVIQNQLEFFVNLFSTDDVFVDNAISTLSSVLSTLLFFINLFFSMCMKMLSLPLSLIVLLDIGAWTSPKKKKKKRRKQSDRRHRLSAPNRRKNRDSSRSSTPKKKKRSKSLLRKIRR